MRNIPSVTLIILNWNGKEITFNCLNSLFKNTEYPKNYLNVVVIDNGSKDGSVNFLKSKFADQIDVLDLKSNEGFILGNNSGIKFAIEKYDPDYILLLNNDTEIVQRDWINKLVETGESNPKIGIVGPKLIFPNGRIQWSGRKREKNALFLILQTATARLNPGFGQFEELASSANFIGDVNTISGACMLIKSRLIREMGVLDTTLLPMYQEDVEYSFRVWKYGWRVVYRGDVKVVHYEGYSIEKEQSKELDDKKFYWAMRNSVSVSWRYLGALKTLLLGFPIYLAVVLVDKKNKTKELSLRNIKLRKDQKKVKILVKCYLNVLRRRKR